MSNLLVIFGATGHQGTSLITHILSSPTLSRTYRIRGVTRDPSSAKSLSLASKIDLVQGDLTDPTSVTCALSGAHTIFFTTIPSWDAAKDYDYEWTCGKTLADAAVAQGAQFIVFSTLPDVRGISGDKYTRVTPFDVKAKLEQYIRGLDVKSAFVSLGNFMENFEEQFFLKPRENEEGRWVVKRNHSVDIEWPLIGAVADTGKFVGAILSAPEKFAGKRLHCAEKVYTYGEILGMLSKSCGKEIVFERVSDKEFGKGIPVLSEAFMDAAGYCDEFGYLGPGQKDLVKEAIELVKGVSELLSFERFLETNPFTLG